MYSQATITSRIRIPWEMGLFINVDERKRKKKTSGTGLSCIGFSCK